MSNGPPTPPPADDRERIDQERNVTIASTSLSPTETNPAVPEEQQPQQSIPDVPIQEPEATGTPVAPSQLDVGTPLEPGPGRPNVYQLLLPSIADLTAQRNWPELIDACERGDLNFENSNQPTRLYVTVPLVLAYLITDNIPPARFALERLPATLARERVPQALYGLVASVSQRKYTSIFGKTQHLDIYTGEGADPTFGPIFKMLLEAFTDSFRQRTCELLSRAYTTVTLSQAQTYLGLPADHVIAVAQEHGWAYDASTQTFRPSPPTSTGLGSTGRSSKSAASTLTTFNFVADGVIRLEA